MNKRKKELDKIYKAARQMHNHVMVYCYCIEAMPILIPEGEIKPIKKFVINDISLLYMRSAIASIKLFLDSYTGNRYIRSMDINLLNKIYTCYDEIFKKRSNKQILTPKDRDLFIMEIEQHILDGKKLLYEGLLLLISSTWTKFVYKYLQPCSIKAEFDISFADVRACIKQSKYAFYLSFTIAVLGILKDLLQYYFGTMDRSYYIFIIIMSLIIAGILIMWSINSTISKNASSTKNGYGDISVLQLVKNDMNTVEHINAINEELCKYNPYFTQDVSIRIQSRTTPDYFLYGKHGK